MDKAGIYNDKELKYAARSRDPDVLDYAIDYADSSVTEVGLYDVCKAGNLKCVQLMIKEGANDWGGAIQGAIAGDHLEILSFIYFVINETVDYGNRHIVCGYCTNGNYQGYKAYVRPEDKSKYLYAACRGGNPHIISSIISNKPYVLSALTVAKCIKLAATFGHINIVIMFMRHKKVNKLTEYAWECIILSSIKSGNIELVEYLIDVRVWPDVTLSDALLYACNEGLDDICKLLIANHAYNNHECCRHCNEYELDWLESEDDEQVDIHLANIVDSYG